MEHIWAPWRMEYVGGLAGKGKACFLCEALAGDDDAGSLVLRRGERCFVIVNRYPYNNGHLMVAVNRHEGDLAALTEEETSEMMRLAREGQRALSEEIRPHGFNIGINVGRTAGAGVADHLHLHVVPRWDGDTNFMATVGRTRVISQSLEDLYAKLKPRFEGVGGAGR